MTSNKALEMTLNKPLNMTPNKAVDCVNVVDMTENTALFDSYT